MNLYRGGREMRQICVDVEYSWGTSFRNGDVEEFLRIMTPQWRREGIIEEQVS